MVFAPVQSKTAVSTVSGTAITATFDSLPAEGNLLFASVFTSGVASLPASNWGPYDRATGNLCAVFHFFRICTPDDDADFLVTSALAVTWAVSIREYTADGLTHNDYFVANSVAPANSTYTIATAGISEEADLVVMSFGQQGGTIRTVTSWSGGMTEVCDLQPTGTVAGGLAVADQVLDSQVDVSCTITLSGTTTNVPSKMIQALFAEQSPGRQRHTQQAASGRW